MNKATTIDDSTTYMKELQGKVESLTQELHQMEATSYETTVTKIYEVEVGEDMNKEHCYKDRESKRGSFKKLMEEMNLLGFELIDTNLIIITSALFIEGCMQMTLGKVRTMLNLRED
ncbi:hypothetical protein TanjilG_09026 [Lupinus angustifolius]|uniref:Uncharacterized protein n=1 Tax=Lupinus angustifolius TaxID=3871 RepID=A0A4P1QPE0_LUPAN|nr:PREDICTED: uncharacterized protein LOC109334033 [Lupinus angustifolius]OIV91614.1 hypothetical protein TanjilG_09026 [Lupinus angustifolius]